MISRSRVMVLTALAALSVVSVFAAADITGKWTAAFDTQIGEQKYTYDFQVKGPSSQGPPRRRTARPTSRTARSTAIPSPSWRPLDFQGMTLDITYTGKIVSDDQIDFTRKVADIATGEARRQTRQVRASPHTP